MGMGTRALTFLKTAQGCSPGSPRARLFLACLEQTVNTGEFICWNLLFSFCHTRGKRQTSKARFRDQSPREAHCCLGSGKAFTPHCFRQAHGKWQKMGPSPVCRAASPNSQSRLVSSAILKSKDDSRKYTCLLSLLAEGPLLLGEGFSARSTVDDT